jgi:hypothetical protein
MVYKRKEFEMPQERGYTPRMTSPQEKNSSNYTVI